VRHLVSEAFYKNAKLTRSVIQRVWEFPTCKRLDENSVPDPACVVYREFLINLVIRKNELSGMAAKNAVLTPSLLRYFLITSD